MPEEDMVDIKFRLYDGSDIGPFRCSSSTSTVDMLKQRIVSDWPREMNHGKFSGLLLVFGYGLYCCLIKVHLFGVHREHTIALQSRTVAVGECVVNLKLLRSIWGKTITPKVVNEIKLISSGKVLDNNKTVGQCRTPFGEVAGGVIIMHVVVQPSLAKTKTEKKLDNSPKQIACSCSIM
ncbi:hypothetical protein NC651_034133 [Populus alba x Populus x berolinensis]|nr:hypothetical protein NC651_034133 [Populus alba x Populus x berolinensis]